MVVTGVPGAGKSTVARLLARRFPLAAHIEGDELQNLIVSGGLHPQEDPPAEARRQLGLRTANACLLADNFAANGVVPIVDDTVVDRERLRDYVRELHTRPLRLVVLAPTLSVALARDRERGYKQVGHLWSHLDEILRRELTGTGLWLDTSAQAPAETVETILGRLDAAIVG